ncbi:MAG TPA: flagellar biosynthetic protein FliO [Acidimicrobiales bacterium]|nr:flagellar biosynthetic protein FliO [Acidimicrobiales bacterium]
MLHALLTASAPAHGASPATANTVSVTSLFLQLVIGLGVVLGVIALVARVLRGRAGLALSAARRQGPLAVLARQGVAKGSAVAVVRAGRRVFLVGITAQAVRRLAELDPAELEGTLDGSPPTGVQIADRANGFAPTYSTKKQRPTTTWTSTIEQLRELTVRRG